MMRIVTGAVALILLICMASCAKEDTVARQIAKELKKYWQTVELKSPSKEECEEAFCDYTIGGQNILLPQAEEYDLITCSNPDSKDGSLTIMVTGEQVSLSEFVQGMGFRGYNVEYQSDPYNVQNNVYHWTTEKNDKICRITVSASAGPIEIQVEVSAA